VIPFGIGRRKALLDKPAVTPGDPKLKGMEKWEYSVKSKDGLDSVVHYVRDPKTGKLMDFKFKKHSLDTPGIWGITPEPKVPPL
jgi:hypothetical protein